MSLLNQIGPDLTGIEQLRIMLETGQRPGMAETLDMRFVEVEEGRAVFEATPGAHVFNPFGIVHGGYAATMLDFACGYAVLSRLGAGQAFSTLEIKVAYHRALRSDTGTIRCEGKVLTLGRRTAFTEARLTDSSNRLCASATSTLLITA